MNEEDEEASRDIAGLIAEVIRWKRAHTIACTEITTLSAQRDNLTDALNTATILLDQLLTEMRLSDVTPSPGVIITKAEFGKAMRKLLGRD